MKTFVIRCVIVLAAVFLLGATVVAQQIPLSQQGQAAYNKHAYAEGAPLFLLAAQFEPGEASSHLYNAACCYALAGQKDLAFYSLAAAVKKGWRNSQHTANDEDLATLHDDARWKDILAAMPAAGGMEENRDSMINDLNNLSAFAYQYRIRPNSMGGGQGSYAGFMIPAKLAKNANAAYEVLEAAANLVHFRATSAKGYGTIEASIDQDGRLGKWKYEGKFASPSEGKEPKTQIQDNRDALINQINNIAAYCYQYRIRPSSLGGGNGAYNGVKLPERLGVTEDGDFGLQVVSPDTLKIQAVSKKIEGSIKVTLDGDGRLKYWIYTGDLQ